MQLKDKFIVILKIKDKYLIILNSIPYLDYDINLNNKCKRYSLRTDELLIMNTKITSGICKGLRTFIIHYNTSLIHVRIHVY